MDRRVPNVCCFSIVSHRYMAFSKTVFPSCFKSCIYGIFWARALWTAVILTLTIWHHWLDVVKNDCIVCSCSLQQFTGDFAGTTGLARWTEKIVKQCSCIMMHYVQNCADDIRLYPWPITSVLPWHLFTDWLFSFSLSASLCWQQWHDCTTCGPCVMVHAVAAPQIWNMLPRRLKNSKVSRKQF